MEERTMVTPPIGRREVERAGEILKKYKQGKINLERRIIDNEQWYKLMHWGQIGRSKNPGDPEPTSAWLFNAIANKHADAMDNYPSPSILPREEGDQGMAEQLSQVLPVILEQNDFEQVYSDIWWYKLKSGTGVTGVFWDPRKQRGLGDIDIRKVDLLNLFWEPGVTDIQKSRHLFHVETIDEEALFAQYPELSGKLPGDSVDVAKYIYDDTVEVGGKVALVDWYYKVWEEGREILHYVKFCGGQVLFASENEGAFHRRGFYDHGLYPFVVDTLFPEEGTPAGFGYVDVCKSPQLYIDKLDQVLIKNAVMAARPRWFIRGDGAINEEEYADWEKDFVHYHGNGHPRDNLTPVEVKPLSELYVSIRNHKIQELKETSGNRDFGQGGTAQGVTAASAIAALQEAGSKLSRDMIKSSYRAFGRINTLCIELMRQFYDAPRYFRILGEMGTMRFIAFSNEGLAPISLGQDFGLTLGMREPLFDVQVMSQKSSPFSSVAQNERAKELFRLGFFKPQLADEALAALDIMDFEGIDKVRRRIGENGQLHRRMEGLTAVNTKLAAIVDGTYGTQILAGMAGKAQPSGLPAPLPAGKPKQPTTAAKERVKAAGKQVRP